MKIVDSNIMNNRKGIGSTNYNVILSALPTAIISHMTIPMKPLDSILFQVKIPGMHDFHCYIACILYLEYQDHSGFHSRSAIPWRDHRFCILLLSFSYYCEYCPTLTYILRSTWNVILRIHFVSWRRINSV
jgi:hypothetical protein